MGYMLLLLGFFTPFTLLTKELSPGVTSNRHHWSGRKLMPNFGLFSIM
jgi:hypothetical protein